jgi:hypothetical protein
LPNIDAAHCFSSAFQPMTARSTLSSPPKTLRDAQITATIIENERRMQLSVSVFNTQEDIGRLLAALS